MPFITEHMVSSGEASQQLSQAGLVAQGEQGQAAADEDVREISKRLIAYNRPAYEELAEPSEPG